MEGKRFKMGCRFLYRFFTVVVSAAILLTGCSNKLANSGNVKDDVVTIRVTLEPNELSDATIKEFEDANPGIKIERIKVTDSKLVSMIAAGTAPDIIRIQGATQLPTFVTKGLALNIQDRIDASKLINQSDFLPVVDIYKWDGKKTGNGPLYGLPKDWSLDQTFFINKSYFKKNGILLPDPKKPMTFEQMADYSKRLHEESDGQTTVFGSCGWEISFVLPTIETYLEQQGKTLWSDDYSKINLNNDVVIKLFNMINAHVQSKAVESPINQTVDDDFPGLFSEGKAAMLQAGYWFSGQLRASDLTKNDLDNYMMLPAIQLKGGQRISACTFATGAIILKTTKYPDEAFKFFEYYFAGKPADDRAKMGFGLPIFKSKMSMLPKKTNFDKQVYEVTMDELENSAKVYIQSNPYIDNTDANAVFEREITPVYFGRTTIKEALPIIEAEIQKLIDQGKAIAEVDK